MQFVQVPAQKDGLRYQDFRGYIFTRYQSNFCTA